MRMRSVLLVGLVLAATVTVGSAQRHYWGNCLTSGSWNSDWVMFNLGTHACKHNQGVKACEWWYNPNRGMGGRNKGKYYRPEDDHRGEDYVYTCKDGEKKYLFVFTQSRYIRCVKKDNHGMYGLLDNVGAWTLKWNPNTRTSQQVINQMAKNRVASCNGEKVQYARGRG